MNKELQYMIYSTPSEDIKIKAVLLNETIWLSQARMAELFDCSSDNISLHLKNIYKEGELQESATTEEISVVQKEGNRNVNRSVKLYNLDAIISVGYRVNSRKATNFKMQAQEKAEAEYAQFNKSQKIISDFDKAVKQLASKNGGNGQ